MFQRAAVERGEHVAFGDQLAQGQHDQADGQQQIACKHHRVQRRGGARIAVEQCHIGPVQQDQQERHDDIEHRDDAAHDHQHTCRPEMRTAPAAHFIQRRRATRQKKQRQQQGAGAQRRVQCQHAPMQHGKHGRDGKAGAPPRRGAEQIARARPDQNAA
ncbi:hypothetical protein KCU90_g2224, partial [Aureobasidium melanogenum]